MRLDKNNLLLYAVTDRHWLHGASLYAQVEQAVLGGASMVQLREKQLDDSCFLNEVTQIQALCRQRRIPFIVNDHVELARRISADGIHVGQRDYDAGEVRALIGADKILGVSAQTVEQALLAEAQGADYLGVGAVFPTGSKDDADAVSLETLKEICAAVHIPVVAIGGIGATNLMQLAGSGICGVAVISAIFAQPDIRAAAESLRARALQMLAQRGCCPGT